MPRLSTTAPVLVLALLLAPACDRGPSTAATAASSASSGPATGGQATSAAPAGQAATSTATVDVGPPTVNAIHRYTGGAKEGDHVPLVLAIHGLGDRPASFARVLDGFEAKAHLVIPAGGLSWGDGFAWWPITGHIDEQNMAAGLSAAAGRLAAALRGWQTAEVSGKPIITGFSQGGMLSFALAAGYPAQVGEALPVAGLLPTPMLPPAWPAGAPLPRIFALHGDADTRVPFTLGRRTVESLRGLGLTVDLKTYSGIGHTITPDMRRDLLAALDAATRRATEAR